MSYKTIKAYLPNVESVNLIMPSTIALAQQFGAHVSGLHVIPGIRYYNTPEAYIPDNLYQAQRDAFKENADKVRTAFLKQSDNQQVACDFQCDGEFHQNQLSQICTAARTSDLFVLAHEAPDDLWLDWDIASSVAIESGRPVLLIPRGWTEKPVGHRVMVAWNGSREAARAAFDALPMLQRASDVVILTLDSGHVAGRSSFSPADEFAALLSRHEVRAEVLMLPAPGGDIATDIQSQITAHGSDLLVMGCYGHTRLREFILGGATREILAAPPIPTLLSH